MTRRRVLPFVCLLPFDTAFGQLAPVQLPPGTPLPVRLPEHVALHVGEPLHAHLLYPVYAENQQVLPADTVLNGSIVALTPDRPHRTQARLRGDFTPFRTPIVRFTDLVLPDGSHLPLATGTATDGAPIFRLVPPPPRKGGFIHQQLEDGKTVAMDRIHIVTGPDKKDRLTQFLYTQLPYHPQRIQKDTAWTVETTSALSLVPQPQPAAVATTATRQPAGGVTLVSSPVHPTTEPATWIVQAYLKEAVTSKDAKSGQAIQAVVAEPIFDPDGSIAVPQGAILEGAITQARPARRFGRAGVLRFDFRQLTLPSGSQQNVQTSIAGIDAAGGANLALDSEGKVKPKPQDKLAVPLLLFALASRPLDRDHGDGGAGGGFGKNAVASNSLGLAGFIAGTVAQAPTFAAGIGYYGTAISVYNRWIKRGEDTTIARNTRIVVQTTARRSAPLRATQTSAQIPNPVTTPTTP